MRPHKRCPGEVRRSEPALRKPETLRIPSGPIDAVERLSLELGIHEVHVSLDSVERVGKVGFGGQTRGLGQT